MGHDILSLSRLHPLSRTLLLLSLAGIVVSDFVGLLPYTLPALGGYALFYAAFRPAFGLQRFAKHGDFSYGLYLYAFPIQQILVTYFRHDLNAGTLTLAAFLLALTCAVLSWHLRRKACPAAQADPAAARAVGRDAGIARTRTGRAGDMKILFCSHLPLTKSQGATKVLVELAEAMQGLGWECSLLDRSDLFPSDMPQETVRSQYPLRLKAHLQQYAGEYDMVDYDHEYLPFSRQEFPRRLFSSRVPFC